MTTLREAAQQALEALEVLDRVVLSRHAQEAITALKAALAEPDGTSAQQSMQTVREGFGRTMSYLTEVFGVSRQTLYNWLSGEKSPSPEHEGKIHQLEVASQRFMELGFKPSPSQLTRTLAQGKSFLELLAAGGDGAKNADKLVNLVQRGEHSRARLEALARTVMLNQTSHDTAQLPPQRPAEPVQEPVVWMSKADIENPSGWRTVFLHTSAMATENSVPLYAAPPQRKPLTDEEPVINQQLTTEPVAWIHTDPDKPRVKFLEWRENEPGYRGLWIKTPLYAAPPQRKPLTEEEIWRTYKNLWMFHPAEEPRLAGDVLKFARAVERAHGIV